MQSYTRRIIICLFAVMAGIWLSSCSDDNVYDSMPEPISQFIARYYPGSDVSSFHKSDGIYTLRISSGPTIRFDEEYKWISIDANGNTVPDMFLYDRLPPALYEYLQSTQSTNSVYSVSRDAKKYELKLLDSTLVYDISTAQITDSNKL